MTLNYLNKIGYISSIRKVPDSGIDIEAKYQNVSFIMQLKYNRDSNYNIGSGEIDKFYRAYCKYFKNTDFVSIFLMNGGYTLPAKRTAENCDGKIFCIHLKIYIKSFKILIVKKMIKII